LYLNTCQDKEDDLKVGIKSTALRFADSTKQWISVFGAASIGNLAVSGYNAELGWCSLSQCHIL
jgi:4-hydroxybenzoate polyprenyltransferase